MKNISQNKKKRAARGYWLNFIEEFWNVKPKYRNWRFGRIEIWEKGKKWAVDELRFHTPLSVEWDEFREKLDLEDVDNLDKFKKLLKKFQSELK